MYNILFVSQATDLSTSRPTPIMNPVMNPLQPTPDTQPRPHAPPISQPSGGQTSSSMVRRKVRLTCGTVLSSRHMYRMMQKTILNLKYCSHYTGSVPKSIHVLLCTLIYCVIVFFLGLCSLPAPPLCRSLPFLRSTCQWYRPLMPCWRGAKVEPTLL